MASRKMDLTGKRFGRLTVIEIVGKTKYGSVKWLCQCDCGNTCIAQTGNLRKGSIKSCGCAKREPIKPNIKTASLCFDCKRSAATPELQCIWDASKARTLPDGAEFVVCGQERMDGKQVSKIKVTYCPLFLPMDEREVKNDSSI